MAEYLQGLISHVRLCRAESQYGWGRRGGDGQKTNNLFSISKKNYFKKIILKFTIILSKFTELSTLNSLVKLRQFCFVHSYSITNELCVTVIQFCLFPSYGFGLSTYQLSILFHYNNYSFKTTCDVTGFANKQNLIQPIQKQEC